MTTVKTVAFQALVTAILCLFAVWSVAPQQQLYIPPKHDGFVHNNKEFPNNYSVLIEAFFDPLDPGSRNAWWQIGTPMTENSVTFSLHTFPAPYRGNAFFASRCLHYVNKINKDRIYDTLIHFFDVQGQFYDTASESRAKTKEKIIRSVMGKLKMDNSTYDAFLSNVTQDKENEDAAIRSFTYGCSRGVTGTPYFFVNGIPLANLADTMSVTNWTNVFEKMKKGSFVKLTEVVTGV